MPATRRVRVWFGTNVVCDYRDEKPRADAYAEAMRLRFRGLRVTIDDAEDTNAPDEKATRLPGDHRMWELTVR